MRMMLLLLGLASSLLVSRAWAQCDCDHTLGTDVTVAVGSDLGVEPGDRVCISGGERPYLRIQGFMGTAEAPVTVINCDGVVRIDNPDRAYALVIEDASEHVRVTGSGDPSAEYGFRISAPATDPYPGIGVWILGRATNIEVDHMEVFDTGFAGVMAKTDPSCDDRPFWGAFVQYDTHLHHLWVHDTGGEGFYIGSTQGNGYNRTCDGSEVNIPHHDLAGVDVHDVLIEDTGWDGIQIGYATDCAFHDSIIRRVGLERVEYQQQGLQLGSSICEVRRNDLRDGHAMGIIVLDVGSTIIADNVIANFEGDGIYANPRDGAAGTYTFIHNTIVGSTGNAIRGFGGSSGRAVNNLLFGNAGGDIALPAGVEVADNVIVADAAAAGVVSASDFHLADDSVARGAGRDLTGEGYVLDLDLRGRSMPPSVGAYEHAADAPDVGAIDASARRDAGASDPGGGEGCGCRAGRSSGGGWLLTSLALMALVARRRLSAVMRSRG